MLYFVFIIFSLYLLLLVIILSGWHKAMGSVAEKRKTQTPARHPLISVIVPFRNERKNLPSLIDSLQQQRREHFEVLLIDDHSTDFSADECQHLIHADPHFRYIKNNGDGKKKAITLGVGEARGELIVTTDADCTFDPNWLSAICDALSEPTTGFVFGAVRIKDEPGIFAELQALEFASVQGMGIGAHTLGFPLFCNGANLAFRKELFVEVNGYEGNLEIASGDDEFLMRKVTALYPDGVKFLNSKSAVVMTQPQPTLNAFVQQRVRWAGKWRFSSSFFSKLLAVFMMLVQLSVLVVFAMIVAGTSPRTVVILLLGKCLLEFVLLFNVSHLISSRVRIIPFVMLQISYPFYVILIGLLSNIASYSWKGRKLRHKEAPSVRF